MPKDAVVLHGDGVVAQLLGVGRLHGMARDALHQRGQAGDPGQGGLGIHHPHLERAQPGRGRRSHHT